jgi:HD superfamily phosphohydrolase
MTTLRDIPEIAGLDARGSLVRIPPELDVPITPRVRRLIDAGAFRRLARISQLGLVALVYPAALHTRFEHSLGVYRLALLFLKRLSYDARFAAAIGERDAELLLVAALLHDIGHWPFCHPIEDIRLADMPAHEQFAERFIGAGEIADVLRSQWRIEPQEVLTLLDKPADDPRSKILASILSGPIDIDKMDYLFRDSLHAGVPYGRNFDHERLIGSLCLNAAGDALAITDKGKTAAEMMVFARYVMFSEVYWHHAVRSATAMLQRGFYRLRSQLDLTTLLGQSEAEFIATLLAAGVPSAGGARSTSSKVEPLVAGLFGQRRVLYKRLAEFSIFQESSLYDRLARRPYPWLVACAERSATLLSRELNTEIDADEVIIDAPPVQREIEFRVDVLFTKESVYRPLGNVSPVVQTLAQRQFDDYVKRVRVFVHPRVAELARGRVDVAALVGRAADGAAN